MKLKSIMIGVLTTLTTYCVQAHSINSLNESSTNDQYDNVAGMAMDASGNTYVLQNLQGGGSGVSIAGMSTTSYVGDEYASIIIDKVTPAGVKSTIAWIEVATSTGSSLKGTGITLASDGKLYVTGYFWGTVAPSGLPSTYTASSTDMFVCSILTTGNVQVFHQDGHIGNGDEYATSIYTVGSDIFVGGYYSIGVPGQYTQFSAGTTAQLLTNNGDRNTFVAIFSATSPTLACSYASGWMTLNPASSAEIRGIAATVSGSTKTVYVTGAFNFGSATTPAITGDAQGTIMFTGRFLTNTNTWTWCVTEGNAFDPPGSAPLSQSAGNGIIIVNGNTLYVAGKAAYDVSTPPSGYLGAEDAILVKYTSIGSAPTKLVVPMGSAANDSASALVYDGTNICIAGRIGQSSNYTIGSFSDTTSAVANVFVARYTSAGVCQWAKVGRSAKANASAIATNSKCEVAFGGFFQNVLLWDVFQKNGNFSPSANHLYCNFLPVQAISFSPNVPTVLNNKTQFTSTASGATSYMWIWSSVFSPFNVTITGGGTPTATVRLDTGGMPGTYFDITVIGSYTRGTSCNTYEQRRIKQTTSKTDETTVGIEDAVESLNTLNVYPNPFANQLQLDYSFATEGEGLMQVVDMQGRVVAETVLNIQNGSEKIVTSEWASGTYVVNLLQAGKTIFSRTIVK